MRWHSDLMAMRVAVTRSRNASVSGRQDAQVRSSCMRVMCRSWSRSSAGASTMRLCSACSPARRDLTAEPRVVRSTRSASTLPDMDFGVCVRCPDSAAWAAFSASMVSDLPRRRRSLRSGRHTSRTSTPASSRCRVRPLP